jgi:hypothetical protein
LGGWAGIQGDDRRVLVPGLWVNWSRGDGGRSEVLSLSPSVDVRVSGGLTFSVGANLEQNRNDRQWYGNFTGQDGVTHYTFAHLDQKTAALTTRFDLTMSPTLTFQVYAQPFVSKGTYTNLRELDQPRATDYDARYQPYTATDPEGFNAQQFRSNVVLRWEYRPGSALYVVWQQGRTGYAPREGTGSWGDDMSGLFQLHPDNTLLLKVSYWFDR